MERNGLEQKRHAIIRNLEASSNRSVRDFDRRRSYAIDGTVKCLTFSVINISRRRSKGKYLSTNNFTYPDRLHQPDCIFHFYFHIV